MEIFFISCFLHVISTVKCYSDAESAESNRFEVAPFYDTIIYNDIADILNDFENNRVSPFELFTDSESQSDEKVENLLTEYHHYLEKAHKQRKNYEDKFKPKNKVPLLRHDQFSKIKAGAERRENEFYHNSFYNPRSFNFEHTSFNNPSDVFMPINANVKYSNKMAVTTARSKGIREEQLPFKNVLFNNKKIFDLTPVIYTTPTDPIKPQCFCKNGYFPCECNCKQCFAQNEPFELDQKIHILSPDEQKKPRSQNSHDVTTTFEHNIDNDNIKSLSENTLNIRIKVDLQLPQFQENFGKFKTYSKTFEPEEVDSKELTADIKFPFTYFSYPLHMEQYGNRKPYKHNREGPASIHKIIVHKKKKPRQNNSNKKHRKHQKIITFHNIKLDHQPLYPIHFLDNHTTTYDNKNKSNITDNTTVESTTILQYEITANINETMDTINATQTKENISSVVYKSNNIYSNTEQNQIKDSHKFENSIETDFSKVYFNVTTSKPDTTRSKRQISDPNKNSVVKINEKFLNATVIDKNTGLKPDKGILTDGELLYWPSISRNKTFIMNNKTITTIILENEHKKTKLNMTRDSIRQNHTKALERAIFGDVNWDDIDTVAPAFMSFVGKYVHGILTFCSEHVCHSMNCVDKICLHRICKPADRFNNKGHCAGSNTTDSVASLESIMDLPSNIAFEVVDILQDNMLGKIFGKATFCINSKCISFVASKKLFVKTRCAIKELNIIGHCSTVKH